jgi:hypothetical protein
VDKLPILGPLKSVAILRLKGELREAYNTDVLQFLYLSIDMSFILVHVNFDDGLSISVLKTRETKHKN